LCIVYDLTEKPNYYTALTINQTTVENSTNTKQMADPVLPSANKTISFLSNLIIDLINLVYIL